METATASFGAEHQGFLVLVLLPEASLVHRLGKVALRRANARQTLRQDKRICACATDISPESYPFADAPVLGRVDFSEHQTALLSIIGERTVFKVASALVLLAILGVHSVSQLVDTHGLIKTFNSNCSAFPRSGIVRFNATFEQHPSLGNETEIRFLPDHLSLSQRMPAGQPTNAGDQVLITNPHYSARLQRKDSGWQVSQIEPADSKDYEGTSRKTHSANILSLVSDPVGTTTDIYTIDSTSEQLLFGQTYTVVKLKFERKTPPELNDIAEARLWFNRDVSSVYPERIERIEQRGANATYVYSEFVSIGGMKYPTRMEGCIGVFTTEEWNSSTPKTGNVYIFDYSDLNSIPTQSDFYLSHYGLPEPSFYTPTRPWWMYVSITGIFIVVIGVLLLRFGRRIQQR